MNESPRRMFMFGVSAVLARRRPFPSLTVLLIAHYRGLYSDALVLFAFTFYQIGELRLEERPPAPHCRLCGIHVLLF